MIQKYQITQLRRKYIVKLLIFKELQKMQKWFRKISDAFKVRIPIISDILIPDMLLSEIKLKLWPNWQHCSRTCQI